jgi:D-alanine-D-alanine ligase
MNGISRESQVPAMLDLLSIPYTASDPLTLATCLHKGRTKEILTYHGIPNSKFAMFDTMDQFLSAGLEFPLVVKPNGEGSSKGIFNDSLIHDKASVNGAIDKMLENYDNSLIAEEYLPGKEFTVAVMGNGNEAEVLPIIEMNFDALPEDVNHIYSYEAKWIFDSPEHQLDLYSCPAEISEELKVKIENTVLAAYKVLNCKDWSRIDVRLDKEGNPNIIEVNPLPGILPDPKNNSCFPKAARMAGLTYEEMINNVLYYALKRYKMI